MWNEMKILQYVIAMENIIILSINSFRLGRRRLRLCLLSACEWWVLALLLMRPLEA